MSCGTNIIQLHCNDVMTQSAGWFTCQAFVFCFVLFHLTSMFKNQPVFYTYKCASLSSSSSWSSSCHVPLYGTACIKAWVLKKRSRRASKMWNERLRRIKAEEANTCSPSLPHTHTQLLATLLPHKHIPSRAHTWQTANIHRVGWKSKGRLLGDGEKSWQWRRLRSQTRPWQRAD